MSGARLFVVAIAALGFLVLPFGRDPALAADQAFFEGFIQAHFLEAAASALECAPADLIGRDPASSEALWGVWTRIPDQQKTLALDMLKVLARNRG